MKTNNGPDNSADKAFDPRLTRQHFSTKIFKVYLRCIEIHYPQVDVRKICENSGLSYEYVKDENNWASTVFSRRFTQECIKATGDPAISYKSGQMSLTSEGLGSLLYSLLRHTFSTTRIYKTLSTQVLHFTKIMTMKIIASENNNIHIKYHPVNLHLLNNEEREALIANLPNIYQNTVGYLRFVPVIHDNPEAEIEHHTELNADGFPELYMNVRYRDKNPMQRLLIPLLFATLLFISSGLIFGHELPPLFLETMAVKGLLFAAVLSGGLLVLLFRAYWKQKKIPLEAQNTISKMDAQYRELQKAKEKMEALNKKLQKADKLKDDFLSNTSHELRTPLNGIIGIAESLLDGATGGLPEETNQNLSLIVTSGKRLADLVNDILDFSRLKNKDIILKKSAVDIKQLTDIVIMLATPLATGKGLELKNNIAGDFPLVVGDENRLNQILLNLIGNAVKFSERGRIAVHAAVDGAMARISVSDTGIGIPTDKHTDIFKSFEQADSSIEREYGGTGLGLSVTKSLVEIHGGRIWVDSSPGNGSTFFFTIPMADESVTNRKPPEEKHKSILIDENPGIRGEAPPHIHFNAVERRNSDGDRRMIDLGPPQGIPDRRAGFQDRREKTILDDLSGINVLAVDDEPINLQVIINNLRMAGAAVYTAHSGMEALDISRQMKPDIILLDIMMPKMNGFATAEQIRRHFSREELPIIYLTAKNQVRDLVDGFSSGGNDYITKPLSKNELMARIRFHVGLTRSRIKLAEAELKYRTILTSIEDGYFETDLAGNFTFCNSSLCRMLACGKDELLSLNYLKMVEGENSRMVFATVNKVFLTGEPVKGFEFDILRQDGSKLAVEASVSLIRDAEDRPLGFRGIARDISDRKEKEKAEKERKIAEAATQAKSEFLANISHEIRTPMNAIIGFSRLALESELPEKRQDYLQKIKSSAGILLGIINEILDYSKIEAGKMTMECIDFQLHAVLEKTTDMFAAKIAEKGLDMIVSVDPDIPAVLKGDPLRLGQILTNLTGNALKFTEKGQIILQVAKESLTDSGHKLRFSVRDTGIGISADQKTRLFSAFTQADSSTTRHYGGTGLGLSICKHLVEMMDGEIDFASEPGRGSTFFFTACFGKGDLRKHSFDLPDTVVIPQSTDIFRGKRILLVEDNGFNQQVATEILANAGIQVEIAGNGREALVQVGDTGYDAVLMDIQMPIMDGYEATRLIRKDERCLKLPIIAMTARTMKEDYEQCLSAGMNAVVNKPIDPVQLFGVLEKWMKKKSDPQQPSRLSPPSFAGQGEQPAGGLPGIDVTAALKRLNGNKRLLLNLFQGFAREYAEIPREIAQVHQNGQMKECLEYLHTLKGVAGNIAAVDLHALADGLEKAIQKGDPFDFETHRTRFEMTLVQLKESIAQLPRVLGLENSAQNGKDAGVSETASSLQELKQFLMDNNYRALESLAALKNCFNTPAFSDLRSTLEDQIHKFEFKQALQTLARMESLGFGSNLNRLH